MKNEKLYFVKKETENLELLKALKKFLIKEGFTAWGKNECCSEYNYYFDAYPANEDIKKLTDKFLQEEKEKLIRNSTSWGEVVKILKDETVIDFWFEKHNTKADFVCIPSKQKKESCFCYGEPLFFFRKMGNIQKGQKYIFCLKRELKNLQGRANIEKRKIIEKKIKEGFIYGVRKYKTAQELAFLSVNSTNFKLGGENYRIKVIEKLQIIDPES